jgi:phospholipase C
MKSLGLSRYAVTIVAASALLAGCGGSQPPIGAPGAMLQGAVASLASRPMTRWPIQHVIVVVQQERSFENLFTGYPGANAPTSGCAFPEETGSARPRVDRHAGHRPSSSGCPNGDTSVALKPITLQTNHQVGMGVTLPDTPATFNIEWDKGSMDGFDLIYFGPDGDGPPAKLYPYAYVDRSETKPYWDLAKKYALADHMFSTEDAGSVAASQVLIAGSTALTPHLYVVGATNSGGCDAPPGTRTILSDGKHGPAPCFTWKTMADLFDARGVSWKYYTLLCTGRHADFGCAWDAFEAIKAVRYGQDWTRNISIPNTNIFADLKRADFPAVSWVTPTLADSDDSVSGSKGGPPWVTSIVDAVQRSRYWQNTAIVVVWGDWGGYYDNMPPPQLDSIGLSVRVPMLVISPYAKRHYVSHTEYEFGSILKFMEQDWKLRSLGTTDERATSIADMFDFTR